MFLGALVDLRGAGGDGEFFPLGEERGGEGEEEKEGFHGVKPFECGEKRRFCILKR
jgi:hypothetical protein